MSISAGERNALHKALVLDGAARVKRLSHGRYAVPSQTQPGVEYLVCGVRMDGRDHTCSCEAGNRGIPCWHVAAVRLARVQSEAKRQARRLAQAPAVTMPARHPYPSRHEVALT
jgi:hypothetical protein